MAPAPVLLAEVPVGLEPVTVRARGNEAWVVNHMSGSISIVDLATLNVKQTLLVGPEPTDVVFAGNPERAFVCVSQDDAVRVYDANSPGAPTHELFLEGSDPRSLAVGKDGDKVYVVFLDSGNKTTVIPEAVVDGSLGLPPPSPSKPDSLPAAPATSLIVRHNGTNWVDEIDRVWDFAVPYQLADNDVVEIDVAGPAVTGTVPGVGTALFNVAVNPVSRAPLRFPSGGQQ